MKESIEKLKPRKKTEEEFLEKTRKELEEIKKKELVDKSSDFLRWKGIDIGRLTDDDLKMWDRSKEEDFTWEEFQAFHEKVLDELKEKENNSRGIFVNLLSDKVITKIEKQQREEINRE